MKSFKKFWKDYWDLCIESLKFIKQHWIGVIIFSVIYTLIVLIIYCPYLLGYLFGFVDGLKEKILGKSEEEEVDYGSN